MRFLPRVMKQTIVFFAVAVAASLLFQPLLKAQQQSPSEAYLKQIADNTLGIWKLLDEINLSTFTQLQEYIRSWMAKDDSVSALQQIFAQFGAMTSTSMDTQKSVQPSLLTQLFKGATPQTFQNANDLAFQTLLGMPFYAQDPRGANNPTVDPKKNYIINASGLLIPHLRPRLSNADPQDQTRYANYYNAVMATQSFNAYVLSGLYADHLIPDDENNPDPQRRTKSLSTLQKDLITQASNSDWFVKIASEDLGLVFRQLLMYQSQLYVVTQQLLNVQKQLVAAQAMNNTLIIAGNMNTESMLYDKAVGSGPLGR